MSLESWARENISELQDMPAKEVRSLISRSRRVTAWLRSIVAALLIIAVILVFPINRLLPLRYGDLWNAVATGAVVGLAVVAILLPLDYWERRRLKQLVRRELGS